MREGLVEKFIVEEADVAIFTDDFSAFILIQSAKSVWRRRSRCVGGGEGGRKK